MEHSFDIDIATEYGINCAILLRMFYFWIEKNRANGKHEYDGRFWTYNSVKSFEKLFPYLSGRQISSAIKKLIEAELLVDGNYNDSSYDRTKWYALTDKAYSVLKNSNSHFTKMQNGDSKNVEPIPVINRVIISSFCSKNNNTENLNIIINNNIYKDSNYIKSNTELFNSIKEWMMYKDEKKEKYNTQMGMSKLLTEIINHDKDYGTKAVIKAIDITISHNWKGISWDDLERNGKKVFRIPEQKIKSKPEDNDRPPLEEYLKSRI